MSHSGTAASLLGALAVIRAGAKGILPSWLWLPSGSLTSNCAPVELGAALSAALDVAIGRTPAVRGDAVDPADTADNACWPCTRFVLLTGCACRKLRGLGFSAL